MKENIKFSIVIPVYNTRHSFIDECILSVNEQNYSNYEIIIVDDGSDKETSKYVDKYTTNKTVVIHQKNQGLPMARISGIKASSGDYVVFLDSDDILASNALTLLNQIITINKIDVVMYCLFRFSKTINNVIYKACDVFKEGIVEKKEVLNELVSLHITSFCTKCAKRELLNIDEKNIDPSIVVGEDLQQSTNLLLKASNFYYTKNPIYYYRVNEDKRDYYDVGKLDDMNFLIPTYNKVFKNNIENNFLFPSFKLAAINSIIFRALKICKYKKDYTKYLDLLNNLEITNILAKRKEKIPFANQMIFNLIYNRWYFVINILSKIYKIVEY